MCRGHRVALGFPTDHAQFWSKPTSGVPPGLADPQAAVRLLYRFIYRLSDETTAGSQVTRRLQDYRFVIQMLRLRLAASPRARGLRGASCHTDGTFDVSADSSHGDLILFLFLCAAVVNGGQVHDDDPSRGGGPASARVSFVGANTGSQDDHLSYTKTRDE